MWHLIQNWEVMGTTQTIAQPEVLAHHLCSQTLMSLLELLLVLYLSKYKLVINSLILHLLMSTDLPNDR
jgi:hypothetical protein